MDVSNVFSKLRSQAVSLEKKTQQLKQALHGESADYEDKYPTEFVHDLNCEVSTLKENINASLEKNCWEKQAINNFIEASEILMRRSAADIEQIRELFQKYGYTTCVEECTEEEETSVENKSDEEKACTEKPLVPKDMPQNPQLSDFGLSKYAFSGPLSASKGQHATDAWQENSNIRTPLKPETLRILPKTPKCMLKMDDYECVTPRLEQFGISEHTICMNEDYTMSLLHKTALTSKEKVKTEVNVPEPTPRRTIVTPRLKVTPERADWITSPMVLTFCTPDVKTPTSATRTVLQSVQETDELPLPSHTETPQVPHFEARWLTAEDKDVKQGIKIESVTKNDATDKQCREDKVPFVMSSDEYLNHFGDPSPPPQINHYDQLLSTPPPPELTRIPDDVLQILSKYSDEPDSSKAKKMGTKAGSTARYENDFADYCNKENRGYAGFFKPNI